MSVCTYVCMYLRLWTLSKYVCMNVCMYGCMYGRWRLGGASKPPKPPKNGGNVEQPWLTGTNFSTLKDPNASRPS